MSDTATRTEPAVPSDIAALIRNEIDVRVSAMQAEAQARAQAAVPDTSTREAAEKRILEAVAAVAELKADNAKLTSEFNTLAARAVVAPTPT
jgi:hypothetical protein